MNFPQAIASGFKKYANFYGRATRSEYWYWMLFYVLGGIAVAILDAAIFPAPPGARDTDILQTIYSLIFLLPTWAIEVRRLHDVNRSGWWVLIAFTVVGILYPLLVWKCMKGTDGPNRYGEDTFQLRRIAAQFE